MPKFQTILIVDDSDLDRETLRRIVEKNGYSTITASSADQGIQIANNQKPDCILMDVVMSDRSGLDALRELKDDAQTKDIPVILCTTKGMKVDVNWGRRNGADDYIIKPIKEAEIIQALQKLEA